MEKKMSVEKKKMIYSLISMSCILCLICISLVLLPNGSFSWFAENENVEGSQMGVGVEKNPLKVEYARRDPETLSVGEFSEIDRNDPLNFLESDIWYPGYSVVFDVKITNVGASALCVSSVGFCAPTEEEEHARVVEDTSYYLGTQLSAAVLAINEASEATPVEQRLLTLNGEEPNRVELVLYEDPGQSLVLQASESLLLTVRLTFVNENFSQDVYRDFGKEDGNAERCQRRMFVDYVPLGA